MKKFFYTVGMIIALGFISSCADDDLYMDDNYMEREEIVADASFEEASAEFESSGLSKMALTSDYKFNFQGNEKLAIFHNKSKVKSVLSNTLGIQGTKAKFSGTISGGKGATQFYGIIPASAATGMSANGKINVTLSSQQSALPGTFDPNAHIYSSYSTSATTYTFKTVNSFLMIENPEGFDFKEIELVAKNGEKIAGDIVVNSSDASFQFTDKMQSSIKLSGSIQGGNTYFICLAPGDLNGYELKATTTDGVEYLYTVNDPVTFKRNGIKKVSPNWVKCVTVNFANRFKDNLSINTIVFDFYDNIPNWENIPFNSNLDENGDVKLYDDKNGNYYVLSDCIIFANELMNNMFENCELTEVKFNNFRTDKVEQMAFMFQNCTSLSEIDLSGFNTSKLKNVWGMFYGCMVLNSIDLSSFDTKNVVSFNEMFFGCSFLKTIYVDSNKFVVNDNQATNMFEGCSFLVGGNGTQCVDWDLYFNDPDYEPVFDHTMARVDGKDGLPGLFTEKSSLAK